MVVIRDESAWPVVKISLGEQFDMETVQEYMAYWEALLARKTSFGMLMLQPGDRKERPAREVTGIYTNWCKDHKIEIASSCALLESKEAIGK